MEHHPDGKVVIITGASSGIGRGFAHALGEGGAKVAVVDIDTQAAKSVAHESTGKGVDAMDEAIVSHWGTLAAEWATRRLRVNSISPGYTRTALVDLFIREPAGAENYPVWMERTP